MSGDPRFLVTDESRRLGRWLRLCGYDTVVLAATPLTGLYRRAHDDRRIVITRNSRVHAGCLFRMVRLASEALDAYRVAGYPGCAEVDELKKRLQKALAAL